MSTCLPVFLIIRNALIYIRAHFRLMLVFFAFSFLGIFSSVYFKIEGDMLLIPIYIIYTYILFYAFACAFFEAKPLFNRDRFLKAAGRMAIILVLAFAAIVFLHIGVKFLKFLAYPLHIYPSVYEPARSVYHFVRESVFVQRTIIFSISTFIFFIPAFAWVSSIVGREDSITAAFFRTKRHYGGLFSLFLIVFGLLPLLSFWILDTSMLLAITLSAAFSIFQAAVYFKTYEVFYRY